MVHLFLYLLRFPFVIAISLSHWIHRIQLMEGRKICQQTLVEHSFVKKKKGTVDIYNLCGITGVVWNP